MIIIASQLLEYSSINKQMQMHYYSMMLWYMHYIATHHLRFYSTEL